jgi:hypothetical protein
MEGLVLWRREKVLKSYGICFAGQDARLYVRQDA